MDDGAVGGPAGAGELVTEVLAHDGGRRVSVWVPTDPPEFVVLAGDGQLTAPWGAGLVAAGAPSTMVVGAHRADDEGVRLREYSPTFDAERFSAHERFVVDDVRHWVRDRFGVSLPTSRTAVLGVSAGGELALALGLRHPDVYGAVFCASPGGGYRPPAVVPRPLPRCYFVTGTREPWFRENAVRWADALRGAGADVVVAEREGEHGGPFWQAELPRMVAWACGREAS